MQKKAGSRVRPHRWRLRPVIFRDARPEYPYHDDWQQSEESLEQGTVDFSICCVAEVSTDNILKDLPDGK